MSQTIGVQDLQVGMYIHLDLGWMSHPFPLSSFRIHSSEQISTIRSLGLQRLRWSPERSALEPPPARSARARDEARAASFETSEQRAARRRRELLAAQRAATQLCERQYVEAGRIWRDAIDVVPQRPEEARTTTESLTSALLDKMLVDGEMCIRLLSSGAGDRATAHALNVAVISLLLGRGFGLARDEMLDLGVGSLLHDIGKLDIPDRLHHLEDGFTSAELNAYRDHVARGVATGRRMMLAPAAMLVLAQHHELADGTGFPMRLTGERIATGARIVALVNRYDNLCNPALLARAMTPHEALSILFAQSRSKYDTTVLNAFIKMMGVYPAGSVVQLSDERYAMVVSVNSSRPLRPRLLVHDPRVARDDALYLDLEKEPEVGIRRSLSPSRLPREALEYLAPRQRLTYFFEPAPTHAELESLDAEVGA
ncbi:phosphohydrolase [Rubrivivax gelatinosus]|uniref:HD-GYP domain-containing protein n=1 Tax=Rubrivivax gelatinosus TaxID=28068 RepID=UPI0019042AC5|nr:HD-GYP domain-containing protein [Rubrivivax gelatinosus]MBK1614871.1 phosphohydrolase [Rubrivivax gelatinosus]